jgi:CheY-like chemotaxis protein
VLVVDDDADVRELVCDVLHSAGLTTGVARHGHEALAVLRSEPWPAVIVLDMHMPVMNGLAFLAALEDLPSVTRPAVIVITGAPMMELDRKAGVTAVLYKPVMAADLIAVVRPWVRDREDERCEPR